MSLKDELGTIAPNELAEQAYALNEKIMGLPLDSELNDEADAFVRNYPALARLCVETERIFKQRVLWAAP